MSEYVPKTEAEEAEQRTWRERLLAAEVHDGFTVEELIQRVALMMAFVENGVVSGED